MPIKSVSFERPSSVAMRLSFLRAFTLLSAILSLLPLSTNFRPFAFASFALQPVFLPACLPALYTSCFITHASCFLCPCPPLAFTS
jgi:hypothetical protein